MALDLVFELVKNEVGKRIAEWEMRLSKCEIEMIQKGNEGFSAIFDFEHCILEIDVYQNEFAPYRYVAIEIAAIVEGKIETIYLWYDKPAASCEEIVTEVDKGILYAVNYGRRVQEYKENE